MKNKKLLMYIIIILLIIFILFIGYAVINNKKKNKNYKINEYIPEEEMRETNVKLFFWNEENNCLEEEIRKIDSKKLLENPEKKIIELLLEGPKEKNLKRIIPENTKIISIEKNGETAVLNFSKELKSGEEFTNNKENIINSILKTVLQLNEISNIKILVEGEEI